MLSWLWVDNPPQVTWPVIWKEKVKLNGQYLCSTKGSQLLVKSELFTWRVWWRLWFIPDLGGKLHLCFDDKRFLGMCRHAGLLLHHKWAANMTKTDYPGFLVTQHSLYIVLHSLSFMYLRHLKPHKVNCCALIVHKPHEIPKCYLLMRW